MPRVRAPYLEWAKLRPSAAWDLAASNLLACTLDDLPGAREALALAGPNDNGYPPLVEAIAARCRVPPASVVTATGASGANFLVFAALLEPGDDVLVERPGYDPLLAAPRVVGARINRFDRRFDAAWALDPDRVEAALTPRTRLIVITNLHNPSGVRASGAALAEVGRLAARAGAHVLVDEVYLDALFEGESAPAATLGDRFITTSSLTKSYGLAGLRCGWVLAEPAVAERIRRARDLVDGVGAFPAEALAALAFQSIDQLAERARTILAGNWAVVRAFLDGRADWEYVPPAGGTVAFPRVGGVTDTSALSERLLAEFDVAVVPGRFFEAPSHVRLSFGGRPEMVAQAVARLRQAL